MNTTTSLLSPYSLAGLTLPNRIVMPPLVIWRAGEDGLVTQDHREHYRNSGGPGLMIVEATAISPEGRLSSTQLGIWSDTQVAGLSELAKIIHSTGAMAGIQIHHAGNRSTLKHTYGEAPLVVSLLESSPDGARELTEADISRLIGAFAGATRRAVEAGFDYVELHGAHGYLMSQFLSPNSNKRTDRWGGSFENRMRFTSEAYSAAAAEGRGRAVGIRFGLADGKTGGITTEEGLRGARELVSLGCPVIHVSNAGGLPDLPDGADSGFGVTMQLAGMVKESVDAVVIGVGDILTPEDGERAINSGMADLVAVGRGMLADPDWAEKADGNPTDIEVCRQCRPRCFHFKEPEKCPARVRLEKAGGPPRPKPLG